MGQCDKADDRATAQKELIRVYEGTLPEIAGGSSRTAQSAFDLLIPYLDSAMALVGKDPSMINQSSSLRLSMASVP